jgi:DNA-binding response OmpR family regulator
MAISLRPRLLIMDIGLRGDLDGIETFQRIREKIDIPVIFASAHSDEVTMQRVRAAQPHGFVLKPFEDRELRTTIEMALYRHSSDQVLRDNENLFRRIFETLPDGLLLEDSTRKVQLANPSFFRIFRIPVSIPLTGETRGPISHIIKPSSKTPSRTSGAEKKSSMPELRWRANSCSRMTAAGFP